MGKLWTRNRKFQSTSAFIQFDRLKDYLTFMMIFDILHELPIVISLYDKVKGRYDQINMQCKLEVSIFLSASTEIS